MRGPLLDKFSMEIFLIFNFGIIYILKGRNR